MPLLQSCWPIAQNAGTGGIVTWETGVTTTSSANNALCYVDMGNLSDLHVTFKVKVDKWHWEPQSCWSYPQTITTSNVQCNFQWMVDGVASEWVVTYGGDCAPEPEDMRIAREARELAAFIKRESAFKRSEELLLVCLNAEQRVQYLQYGYFETLVNDKLYRINKGRSGNVELIDKGVAISRFCIHERDYVPAGDTMLSQLLMLKTDEAEFLKIANRTVLHP